LGRRVSGAKCPPGDGGDVKKALTEDDVIWAYRICLGREPENALVLQHHYLSAFDAIGTINRYARQQIEPSPAFVTNVLGVKTRPEFYPRILTGRTCPVEPPPIPANWHSGHGIVRRRGDKLTELCDRNDTALGTQIAIQRTVHIELTSTLTQEDENRLAPAVLRALSGLLDMLPISYLVRVETTDQSVIEHVSPGISAWDANSLVADMARPVVESWAARAGTGFRYSLLMIMRPLSALGAAVLLMALACGPAWAQSAANVLLVVNQDSPESVEIGNYYAAVRGIPSGQIVRISAPVTDSLSRFAFDTKIQMPIASFLAKHLLQDQVLYIVLTKGVPLRVEGTDGLNGTVASVDSELTLLYRRMVGSANMVDSELTLLYRLVDRSAGSAVPAIGRVENPLFLGDKPVKGAKRFSRFDSDLYLVTRLDGFAVADVKALIDRAAKPVRDGQIVLDQKGTLIDRGGDAWLQEAADRLVNDQQGARVQLESTRTLATVSGPVIGYFSWGSNDPANQRRAMGLSFVNGAIGGMFVSTDGRTFREPHPNWKPAIAGSATGGQSLVGDLIREGITGVVGHVAEPYLDSIVRPQILFPAYLAGFNLAESFYLAMPFLSWQDIVVGDPLCSPFQSAPAGQDQLHRGLDQATLLPALFAERRLNSLKGGSSPLNAEALTLNLRGWSLLAQGKPDSEVDAVLERATVLEPRLVAAQLRLSGVEEGRKDYDRAIERYRAVLAADPGNVFALNNLAFALADHKDQAKDALPLAQRAYALAGETPAIADTLGWVHFKLGEAAKALPLLDRAAKGAPASVDILVHAAIVHASVGNPVQARLYLDAAIKADPKAAERSDVKALIGKLVI
jgi:uncharacterized protein (TIGR03790 family)